MNLKLHVKIFCSFFVLNLLWPCGTNIEKIFVDFSNFNKISVERELDYYHQKVNIQIAPRVVKWGNWKLGNFKEISEILEVDSQVFSRLFKRQFLTVVVQNSKKSAVKHSTEKPTLLILWICLKYFVQGCSISSNFPCIATEGSYQCSVIHS